MPHQGGSGKRLVFDIEPKASRWSYKKSEQFKNLGMYGESEDITGGMGLEGVIEFQKFVNDGRRAGDARDRELLPGRSSAWRRRVDAAPPVGAVLRARADRRGRDSQGRASDLLRLRQEDRAGPLRERAAAAAARHRQEPGADAVPRRRQGGVERADEGGRRDPEAAGDRGRARGKGRPCCSPPTRATAGRTSASSTCCSTRC